MNHLTLLSESGMDKVGLLSKKPVGVRLRAFCASKVLAKLRRGEAVRPVSATPEPAPAPLPAASASDQKLDKLLDAMTSLSTMVTAVLRGALPTARQSRQDVAASLPLFADAPIVFIPRDWRTAEQIADIATYDTKVSVSADRVHRIIRRYGGIRNNTMLARTKPAEWTDELGGKHVQPKWHYHPSVIPIVIATIKAPSAPPSAGDDSKDGNGQQS